MIKMPKNVEELQLNVFLKDGTVFMKKDTVQQTMGENERIIIFWHDNKMVIYPMEQIDHIEMIF